MSKDLIKQNATGAIERANQLRNSNIATEQALQQSIARERSAQEQAVASNVQAAIEQQAREALQAQLQTTRDANANEVRRIAEDRARIQQELQNKTANEQRVLQENDQLKLQLAALQGGQVNEPEHKVEVPPNYPTSPAVAVSTETEYEVVNTGDTIGFVEID